MNFLKEDNWLDAHKKTDIKPVMLTFITTLHHTASKRCAF